MKNIIILLLSFFCAKINAQVGVNTKRPKADLDINGDFGLRGKLILGEGNVLMRGLNDQVLVSQGANLPPVWKNFLIPDYETDKFYLIFNDSFSDRQGLRFPADQMSSLPPNTLESDLKKGNSLGVLKGKGFKEIVGLDKRFSVKSKESRVYVQFETVVHVDDRASGNIKFACGIFVNEKLENLRINVLRNREATIGTFITHTQIGSINDLPPGENHRIQVACARYGTSSARRLFTIGVNSHSNLNPFMTQSSLKVDVYEVPENFKNIFD